MPKKKSIRKKNQVAENRPTTLQPKDETAIIKKRLDEKSFSPVVLVTQSEESIKVIDQRTGDLKKATKNPDLRETVIDDILGDIVAGACMDRITVYAAQLKENTANYIENLQKRLSMRQSADVHLLMILKVMQEIKQPQPNLTVKEAQQVNVAEKQVNISQKASQ